VALVRIWLLFIIINLALFKVAYGQITPSLTTSLPTPPELIKEVQFWEKIFSHYDADQCVLHDNQNLDVIYFVADIPSHNPQRANQVIDRARQRVEQSLAKFAKGGKPADWFEQHVLRGIPTKRRNRAFFEQAKQRVRCQRGIRSQFRLSFERSKVYLPMIKEKMNRLGLPMDLAYLPHLESGFNSRAKSKVGAAGMWQLMPETARQYMKVTAQQDDRLHPELATVVAARILKDNYRRTQSWPLAITGYNYGINGVMRAMRSLATTDYMIIRNQHKSPIFKFAAKNFYPSFLAVRNLATKMEGDIEQANRGRQALAQDELPPATRARQ